MRNIFTFFFAIIFLTASAQQAGVHLLDKAGGGYHTKDMAPTTFLRDQDGTYYISQYHVANIGSGRHYFELIKYSTDGEIIWNWNLYEDNGNDLPYGFWGAFINDMVADDEGNLYIAGNAGTTEDIKFSSFELQGIDAHNTKKERSFIACLSKETGEVSWLVQDTNYQNLSAATDLILDGNMLYVGYFQWRFQELKSSNGNPVILPEGNIGMMKMKTDGEFLDYVAGEVVMDPESMLVLWDPDPVAMAPGRRLALSPKIRMDKQKRFTLMTCVTYDFRYDGNSVEAMEDPPGNTRPNMLVGYITQDLNWEYVHMAFMYDPYGWELTEVRPVFDLDADGNVIQTFYKTGYMETERLIFEDGSIDTLCGGFLLKYNRSGEILEKHHLKKHTIVTDLLTDGERCYIFGTYNDSLSIPGCPLQTSYGERDIFLAVVSQDLSEGQIYNFGSPADDYTSLFQYSDSTFYMLGASDHKIKFNDEYLMDETEAAFIIELTTKGSSGIWDPIASQNQLMVSPNPASNLIRVDTEISDFSVVIRDLSGRIVFQARDCDSRWPINISSLNSGQYVLIVKKDGQLIGTAKFSVL